MSTNNNLRVLLDNKVYSVYSGSNEALRTLNDYKSQYDTGTEFRVATSAIQGPIAIVVMLSEKVNSITMTASITSGFQAGILGQVTEATISSFSGQSIGFGGGKYVVLYATLAESQIEFRLQFSESVKVSKILIGNYWSPKFNTSFGVQVGYDDNTAYDRLQSGDLYATPSTRNKVLSFDLQYLDETDKFTLFDIFKSVGKSKAVFISIFPQDANQEKEQMYSIYGRLRDISNISYVMYTIYSSSLQLEEI